jgi:signal transduction histidine kinase
MSRHLILKLLAINALVIGFVIVIVWFSIDYLAAAYFSELMKIYNINPESSHAMFLSAAHRYLIWASLGAILLAGGLSFFLMRKVLAPLVRMIAITHRISSGDYTTRVPVTSRDEVGQLAAAFNRMGENLQQIEHLRKTMVVDVAHELRTPLTNIKGYLEALSDGVVPPNQATYSLLQEETERLVRLVEDILRLAKADAARKHLAKEPVSLAEAIARQMRPLALQFESKMIAVDNQVAGPDWQVQADPDMLAQILRNLLENACQHTPAGGFVRILAEPLDGQVKVICANTCVDVDHKDLAFIFERFYRAEKSRSRDHGGAGIGLAIVKELVEAHGGGISAELMKNEIRISFTLPAVR